MADFVIRSWAGTIQCHIDERPAKKKDVHRLGNEEMRIKLNDKVHNYTIGHLRQVFAKEIEQVRARLEAR